VRDRAARSAQRLRVGGSGGSLIASARSVSRVRRGPRGWTGEGDAVRDDRGAGRAAAGGISGSSNGAAEEEAEAGIDALPVAVAAAAGSDALPVAVAAAAGSDALPAAAVGTAVGTTGGIDELPSAGRKFSTVGLVLASGGTGPAGAAPCTSDSTSTGVSASVGVSSVGAPRLIGARIAVVWVLDRVRRGTALRRGASRLPSLCRRFRTQVRSKRSCVAAAHARRRTGCQACSQGTGLRDGTVAAFSQKLKLLRS
jgi:hypothetical protein